jgi:uncharacterized membrane protein
MIKVTLFFKKDAPETLRVREELEALREAIPYQLILMDIDQDQGMKEKYEDHAPVVQVGPYIMRSPFTRQDLQVMLSAASTREKQIYEVGDKERIDRIKRGETLTNSDRISFWLSQHYMLLFNAFLAIYVGLPFLAPVLMKAGLPAPAKVIYTIYSPLCHQLTFRSWFLFGEQAYYPRGLAQIPGMLTYEDISGNPGDDIVDARAFIGNDVIGYKVALCERDIAIYGSLLLFGIFYSITGNRIKPVRWYLWAILGVIPIAVDGLSQLPSLLLGWLPAWFPQRESTPLLRTLTGGLFGLFTAWYLFPVIGETMKDTRSLLLRKFAAAKEENPLMENMNDLSKQ